MKELLSAISDVRRGTPISPALPSKWDDFCKGNRIWYMHANDAGRMAAWMRRVKPRIVVETGTCEALGTGILAEVMASYGGGVLWTFDMAAFVEHPAMPTDMTAEQWRKLGELRSINLHTLDEQFPTVKIRYVDGDTARTLPTTDFGGPIDFWFQDSGHYHEGILTEFLALEAHMAPGGLVVFDDINAHTSPWDKWMTEHRPTWVQHHFSERAPDGGHGQLWCQKPFV